MIRTALVLPSPRALLPGLSATDTVPELRAAATAAVEKLLADGPERLLVVAAPVSDLNAARGVTEPLGHRVARHLLGDAAYEAVLPGDDALRDSSMSGALVVMADGSACRSEKAPGHLHPDALAFDDSLDQALRHGDTAALAALDPEQAHELWCGGVPALHALAAVAGGRSVTTEVTYADAPYGVAWWVARWDLA